ncbi:MAG: hypothetical protein KME26_32855, partial [Oscillatoria princeps RMCB-10]|nr:hypothetical protein [Oscillatoria princeps RMCB-10]
MPELNLNLDLLSGISMYAGLLGGAGLDDLFNLSPSTPATSAPSTGDPLANPQVQVFDSNDTLLFSAESLGILPSWLNLPSIAPGEYQISVPTTKGEENYTVLVSSGDAGSTPDTSNSADPLTGTALDEGTAPALAESPLTDSSIASADSQTTQSKDPITGDNQTVSPDAGSASDSTGTADSASNPQVAPASESQTPPPSTELETAPAPEQNPLTSETEPVNISSEVGDSEINFQVQDTTGMTALTGNLQEISPESATAEKPAEPVSVSPEPDTAEQSELSSAPAYIDIDIVEDPAAPGYITLEMAITEEPGAEPTPGTLQAVIVDERIKPEVGSAEGGTTEEPVKPPQVSPAPAADSDGTQSLQVSPAPAADSDGTQSPQVSPAPAADSDGTQSPQVSPAPAADSDGTQSPQVSPAPAADSDGTQS